MKVSSSTQATATSLHLISYQTVVHNLQIVGATLPALTFYFLYFVTRPLFLLQIINKRQKTCGRSRACMRWNCKFIMKSLWSSVNNQKKTCSKQTDCNRQKQWSTVKMMKSPNIESILQVRINFILCSLKVCLELQIFKIFNFKVLYLNWL